MVVRRTALGHEVAAPAKLNLFLEVLGKRDDGFHNIETLMLPVSLYDTLSVAATSSSAIELTVHDGWWSTAERTPTGTENLVVRALERLRHRAGIEHGANVSLVKRIPMAAGLAGGSSDAAAALLLGNEAWQLGWSRDQLASVAAELGSDIPFFLHSGAAICRGRGERIEPVARLGQLHFVIAAPPEGLSTASVYRACKPSETPRDVHPLVEALRAGRWGDIARCLTNRLQYAAERLSQWIDRLKFEFAQLDFVAHQMSGSGTSYFGICRSARHARRIATQLRSRQVGRVFAVGNIC
jgi:4-diphosphocytidyl-2-C-methyl-D-erythritol kinase